MTRVTTSALLLFGIACGPPPLSGDVHAEGESGDGSTTSATETSETSGIDTTESTGDEGETTSLPGFIPVPDVFEADQCDPFMQDCPDGEKCVPYGSTGGGWDAHKCVPVLGDQSPGEACTWGGVVEATDDCDETSFCWGVIMINGEEFGVCTPFCLGSADMPQCPPDSSCLVAGNDTVNLCVSPCDPVLQDCEEGLACFWANYGFNCIFTTQELPPGAACEFINDCALGSPCVAAEVLPTCDGSACCTPWCELGLGDAQCAAAPGTSCVPFFEEGMAPPGYDHVGVCILP